ncbi:sensor histidine kinase [Bosea sp. 2RAB26]|uniref:sensor histidine kinase n=1 Tax=Bosea sp. 2RAB26 TaxID=3237476 RepID=UPI003F8E68A8
MRLARFKTVRGRLLALLVAIALPIACLSAIAAITTYRTVIASIQTFQIRTADDYAVRARVWYRGALRSLLTAAAAVGTSSSRDCDAAAQEILKRVTGYSALHLKMRNGEICSVSLDPHVTSAKLAATAERLSAKPPVRIWAGTELATVRYDDLILDRQRYLAVYAHSNDPEQPAQEALLLADSDLLNKVFDLGESDESLAVALIHRGSGIVTSRGADEGDESWLPALEVVPEVKARWEAASRAGPNRAYAARMVAEPDLYVIASFDNAAERAAQTQFLILLLTPLLTLALLCFVYLRAIDRHCVRWLRGIETAARTRAKLSSARAPIAADMPSDMRSVAEAFNAMVEEEEVRQRKLSNALDDNRFLVRELHHRVKNSLQVVQSYIGLTKRDSRGEARLALADAECRVHVLSAAYRFTLADGEMQPVRVDLFLDDVMTMISNLIRRRDQGLISQIETMSSLSVDRIIPLGFLIVDVVGRALRHGPGLTVTVTAADIDEETIEISIKADREIDHAEPPKLFAGLLTQIAATEVSAPGGRSLGSWRIVHRD